MPFQQFPYTDFQNLNLDWLLQIVKKLLEDGGTGTGAVISVNGKTGVVVLTASDIGAYVKPSGGIPKTDLTAAVQASLSKADTALQSAPVTSVDGKTGAVTILPSYSNQAFKTLKVNHDGTGLFWDIVTGVPAFDSLDDIGKFLRIDDNGMMAWEDYDTTIKAYINNQISVAISGVDALIGTGVIT